MNRAYFVIDAFTSERFKGNPAAIVLDTEGLDDTAMQAIAAEFNLSETTFVLPPQSPEATLRFRWFTPTTEVAMCGHATIAGVYALVESGRMSCEAESTSVGIDTLSGTLTAFVEQIPGSEGGRMIWLDMPTPELNEHPLPQDELAAVLNVPVDALEASLPIVKTQDHDALVFVKNFQSLNEIRPDFARLKELQIREGIRGMCVATAKTLSPSITVQSRFFAPAVGIDEDPVTGSVHGPLAAYLVAHSLAPLHDGTAGLQCVQAKAGGRAGVVFALVQPEEYGKYAVRIGGQAVTVMHGVLEG